MLGMRGRIISPGLLYSLLYFSIGDRREVRVDAVGERTLPSLMDIIPLIHILGGQSRKSDHRCLNVIKIFRNIAES